MTIVVPAILPESLDDLAQHVARVKGAVSRVQVDVANGSYAPTRTWPYTTSEGFAELVAQDVGLPLWEDFEYEVDLLLQKPEVIFADWIKTGIIGAVVHIESTDEHAAIMDMAQNAGIDLGWGIKPSTPNEKLFDLIETLGMPGFVQVMGNDTIGHHGVELDGRVYDKVAEIRAQYPELPIAVDIGVDDETAPELIDAGATKLVSGSFIFESPNIREAVELLSE
jgi:ribulose-phosphate 3-epimerase